MATLVRALFDVAPLTGAPAPFNSVFLKIYYPADSGTALDPRAGGEFAVDSQFGLMPVAIIMPGINTDTSSYGWLARSLAAKGIVCLCYQYIAEEFPGMVSATPGLEVAALSPNEYGKHPSATILDDLLQRLRRHNTEGVLAGRLDLERIYLGGHSAGGTVALLNADPNWFPGVCGCFSYGSHSAPAKVLNWPEGDYIPLPGKLPTLIMGGTEDGSITNSVHYYNANVGADDAAEPLVGTFDNALVRQQGDCLLAIWQGANHYCWVHPNDHTTGRSAIDLPSKADPDQLRAAMTDVVAEFILSDGKRQHIESLAKRLQTHPLIAKLDYK